MPIKQHTRFSSNSSRSRFSSRRPSNKGRQNRKAYINPSRFIQAAQAIAEDVYVPQNTFSDFDVHPILHDNLQTLQFTHPSPIQDQSIALSLQGKDIIGIANTGTGKTAAFAIPTIHRLMSDKKAKAIILAPTRELAQQIDEQCRAIGKGTGLTGTLLIGGVPMGPQLRELRHNPRIIVGTPGRVKDHLERGSLDISDCTMVVLDEVDRMLDMGFVHDITDIIAHTSDDRQNLYFSATLDHRVKMIIDTFSRDPIHISVKSADTSANVEQSVVDYRHNSEKIEKLHDILSTDAVVKVIVFDETQRSVEKLSRELASRGFSVDSIHGGKTQAQRQRVFNKFKKSDISVLIATDVAARGLDVSDITHVINYSTPQSYDDYVHRIGRTGRAGKTGNALTFVSA